MGSVSTLHTALSVNSRSCSFAGIKGIHTEDGKKVQRLVSALIEVLILEKGIRSHFIY